MHLNCNTSAAGHACSCISSAPASSRSPGSCRSPPCTACRARSGSLQCQRASFKRLCMKRCRQPAMALQRVCPAACSDIAALTVVVEHDFDAVAVAVCHIRSTIVFAALAVAILRGPELEAARPQRPRLLHIAVMLCRLRACCTLACLRRPCYMRAAAALLCWPARQWARLWCSTGAVQYA